MHATPCKSYILFWKKVFSLVWRNLQKTVQFYSAVTYQSTKDLLPKRKFVYDKEQNVYFCPNGQDLQYSTTDHEGYCHYKSNAKSCMSCPLLSECTKSKNHQKVITRHI
jgi:hypothetical protein